MSEKKWYSFFDEKYKAKIRTIFFISLGFLFFVLRVIAMRGYISSSFLLIRDRIFHISNLVSIIVVLALICQFRVVFLNCLIFLFLPVFIFISILDISLIFTGLYNLNIDRFTIHIPSTIISIYFIFHFRKYVNLINFNLAVIFWLIWGFFIDPRFDDLINTFGLAIPFISMLIYIFVMNLIFVKRGNIRGFIVPEEKE